MIFAGSPHTGDPVATIYPRISDVGSIARAEIGANARLIAAAPELLAACRESLSAFEANGATRIAAVLRAAIAKAEGR